MSSARFTIRRIVAALAVLVALANGAAAATQLRTICRVKGQEENTLQGLGLVVGLKGTGDGGGSLPMVRSLATAMELMGNSVGQGGALELKDVKNVALVLVTATVPAAGARQGDQIDCVVNSIGGAKSLEGGYLAFAALQGPMVESPRVYATADGPLKLDDVKFPTTAKVFRGCQLQEEFFNVFMKDDKITLVLNPSYADFQVAQDVASLINSSFNVQSPDNELARAIDPVNIEVRVPFHDLANPVDFVSEVLSLPIQEVQTDARVVINERAGSIVIGADVEIGPVVITHKNIVIETGDNLPADRFIPIDPAEQQKTKLDALVKALQAVKLPANDVIEIIKGIERDGKLYGTLEIH